MLEESIINKLESLRLRSIEISDAIAKEGATDDIASYTQLNKEYAEITPIVNLFKSLKDVESDLSGAQELLESGDLSPPRRWQNNFKSKSSSAESWERRWWELYLPGFQC